VTIRFLAEAEAELAEAVAYYNALMPGLGAEFALEVRDGLTRIEQYPKAWQLLGHRARRHRLSRFPYGLVYALLSSEIVVLAVMHLHRKPDYWKERLTQI
jgi:ParE toxin of type II toxin-antitoxin system, parDE